jgi:hypothetical protein
MAGTTYTTRFWLDVMPNTTGKYDIAIYPSSYGANIGNAIADGNLMFIDPWFDTGMTYKFRNNVNYTGGGILTNFPAPINSTSGFICGNSIVATLAYGLYSTVNGTDWIYCNNNTDAQLVNSAETEKLSMKIISGDGADYTGTVPLWDSNYVAVYSLGESSNPKDQSQYGNNLTATGSPIYNASGLFGGGYSGSGSTNTNYFNTSASLSSLSITNNLTMEAWVFLNSNHVGVNANMWLSKGKDIYAMGVWNDDKFFCWVGDGSTWNVNVYSTETLSLHTWYYIACTWTNAGGWKMFINGKLNNTEGNGGKTLQTTTDALSIISPSGETGINGTIDEIRISNIIRPDSYFNATYQSLGGTFSTLGPAMNQSQFLNIYAYDETTGAQLSNLNVLLQNATTSSSFTTSGTYIDISNINLYGMYSITIGAANYGSRTYFLNSSINNQTFSAYLPNLTSTTHLVQITMLYLNGVTIPGKLITIEKQFNSTYVTVDSQYTDSSGSIAVILDGLYSYRITMLFPSSIQIQTINPTSSIYYFKDVGMSLNYSSIFQDISFDTLPSINELGTSTEENITFNIYSLGGNLIGQKATIVAQNLTDRFEINATGTADIAQAILTIDLSGSANDPMTAYFYLNSSRDGYILLTQRTFAISTYNFTAYNLTLENILRHYGQTSGLSGMTKSIIALLMTLLVTGFVYSKASMSGFTVVIMFVGMLGFFTFVGWFDTILFFIVAILSGLWYYYNSGVT